MVSVLVAVYNVEEYLPICLDSVINQTFSDLEIILVDDGSTDSSGKICECYAEKDKRVKCIHQKNEGLSTTRNTGLRAATGDYILMIDGDDAMHSQMIEILYQLIQSGDYDFSMCYGKSVYDIKSNSDEDEEEHFKRNSLVELTSDTCIKNLFSNTGESLYYKVVWTKLFKHSLLVDQYFKKLPAQDVAQDVEFNLHIYLCMRKAILSPIGLYFHVQRPMSLSRQGVSYRWVNALKTFVYCLNEIPEDLELFRAYCLHNLYYNMIFKVFYTKGTPFHQNAKEITKDILKQTIVVFIKNPYIPFMEKIALTTFNYFPFLFTVYSKLVGYWHQLRKTMKFPKKADI